MRTSWVNLNCSDKVEFLAELMELGKVLCAHGVSSSSKSLLEQLAAYLASSFDIDVVIASFQLLTARQGFSQIGTADTLSFPSSTLSLQEHLDEPATRACGRTGRIPAPSKAQQFNLCELHVEGVECHGPPSRSSAFGCPPSRSRATIAARHPRNSSRSASRPSRCPILRSEGRLP